jgi:hypothetical protein
MNSLFKKAVNRISWAKENVSWTILKPFFKPDNSLTNRFTIGITTYKDRFESCLIPLLSKASVIFHDCQIIVVANGHYDKEEQISYLSKIERFCRKLGNVKLISFTEPRGLSFLWNTVIRNSDYPGVVILNDDLRIKMRFRNFVASTLIQKEQIATINRSWSHFFISKSIISTVGWFDENFPEIGGEDDDYLARLAMQGIIPENFETDTVSVNRNKNSRYRGLNSYGKDMTRELGGYSSLNTRYLFEKWETSHEYFEGAVEVPHRKIKYWKLKSTGREDKEHGNTVK